MSKILAALFSPDILAVVLLAAIGVFIFVLVQPREQDAQEEFWLALIQRYPATNAHGDGACGNSDKTRSGDDGAPCGSRSADLFGL